MLHPTHFETKLVRVLLAQLKISGEVLGNSKTTLGKQLEVKCAKIQIKKLKKLQFREIDIKNF